MMYMQRHLTEFIRNRSADFEGYFESLDIYCLFILFRYRTNHFQLVKMQRKYRSVVEEKILLTMQTLKTHK